MSIIRASAKSPADVTDYGFDWQDSADPLLEDGETLSSSTWELHEAPDSALSIDSDSSNDTVTKVWVSGGTEGVTYRVRNTVTTSLGRTYKRTFHLPIETL